ncbi:hypothetical protein ES708_00649 [subsurface metagenome]
MKDTKTLTTLQQTTLVMLRFLIGWHLLYEGIAKLLNPSWSSAGFLIESKWVLSGFSDWVISNSGVLHVVDFMNTWGLIAIGAGLIVGLFTRIAAISGAFLLFMYYLNNPPLIGLEYIMPSEGNYLIINKTLIETVALLIFVFFPTGSIVGMDVFIDRFKIKIKSLRKETS